MSDKDETAENFSDNEKGNLTKILFFYFLKIIFWVEILNVNSNIFYDNWNTKKKFFLVGNCHMGIGYLIIDTCLYGF